MRILSNLARFLRYLTRAPAYTTKEIPSVYIIKACRDVGKHDRIQEILLDHYYKNTSIYNTPSLYKELLKLYFDKKRKRKS